jgi:hypothetical protein
MPLLVKYRHGDEWSTVDIDRSKYPFIVLFPHFELPNELTGHSRGSLEAKAQTMWIRGAAGPEGIKKQLAALSEELGAVEIMPTGEFEVPPFCLLLAKIAHAFVTAELGADAFNPCLSEMIKTGDTSNALRYVGGLMKAEPITDRLHEVTLAPTHPLRPNLVVVRIRLFACLEAPTYFVVVGSRRRSA